MIVMIFLPPPPPTVHGYVIIASEALIDIKYKPFENGLSDQNFGIYTSPLKITGNIYNNYD